MAYKAEIHRAARKQMLSFPREAQLEIAAAIDHLKETPRPGGCRKLRETGMWRLRVGRYRVGRYRVVYTVDDETKLVTIVKVAIRREDAYKGL